MNRAYILTGGNLGDRAANLASARAWIARHIGTLVRASSVYETVPWGKSDQPSFLNQVLAIDTTLNARQLIRRLLKFEKSMGRVRHEKYGPRIIDLDILLFNDETHDYPFLQLPHPEMQNRRFVLAPLAEIAPDIVHPVLHKTIAALLRECPDPLEVKQLSSVS